MDKHAFWKWLILICMTAFSLALVVPPLDKKDDEGNVVREGKIRFGLDLEGGSSFVVSIDADKVKDELRQRYPDLKENELDGKVNEVLTDSQDRTVEILRNRINSLGIAEPSIYAGKENRIVIQLPGINAAKRADAMEVINRAAYLAFRMVHEKSGELTDNLMAQGKAPEGYVATTVDGRRFYRRAVEKLPEGDAFEEYLKQLRQFGVRESRLSPRRYDFMLEKDKVEGQTVYRPHFVEKRVRVSGDNLAGARLEVGPMGENVVELSFDSEGAKRFAETTTEFTPGGRTNEALNNRLLAIVLDDTLYSAPRIRMPIPDGSAQITGSFSLDEARFLVNVLNAGALPAPLEILEMRSVAPSLGQASINASKTAIIAGGIGVLLFMAIYYMFCGIVADIALILNLVLLPLGMVVAAGFLSLSAPGMGSGSVIKLPVLTLPGIAGILLTVGMAVDANVLIFERIREETRSGKKLWPAISAGYDRAFVTILDANLTTLLTGIILFVFGSGPIRGFAVTLCAGILISMFTALVVTRLFFQAIVGKLKPGALKMLSIIGDTRFDFVGARKIMVSISLVVIVATWALMVGRGIQQPSSVLGVDFTGGASITYAYNQEKPVEEDELRTTLEKAGCSDVNIQYQLDTTSGQKWLQIKTSEVTTDGANAIARVNETLESNYAESRFVEQANEEVGPQVGRELTKSAIWAVVLALLGIIAYLTWRFEFGFALGAIAALAHDVLITVGIFTLFRRQLSLPVIAAVLTIVGYSVNDTIVVFDRIREDLRLVRDKSFLDICNLSINQTLSRTLLTSMTTLITVVMLLVLGGGAIFDFALTLCIGVLVGTYSSIFIATPAVLAWYKGRKPDFAAKPIH